MTRSVLDWLDEAARRTPEGVAFDDQRGALCWAALRRRAMEIGSWIASRVPAQSPVLVLMEKSPACVAAMFGTAYAGCFYTPVDAAMPPARVAMIAQVLRPALILCESKHREMASGLAGGVPVGMVEALPNTTDDALLAERRAAHIDTDLLYVLFTSGSTGTPKGVSITHRSVIDLVQWACGALRLPRGVRFGSQAPFYFDNSVLDIYCAMRMAGSVHLIARMDFLFPRRLLGTLAAQKIDTLFWVPSALTAVANAGMLARGTLSDLKRVFFCGEVMPCRTLNLWKAALPDADFVNMYGPTEITDVCTWYRVDREFADGDSLPIGAPCANTRVYLLDSEICVGGTCLSPGYYNAPERTAEAFVPNPLRPQIPEMIYKTGDMAEYNDHGELMFLGRRDSQIKRSGYRIELGEIECAMNAADGIVLACCYYDAARERIVGAYTGSPGEKALRAALKASLPKYMLPDVLLRRDALPQTGSGKLDRLALRREVECEHPDV